MQMHNMDRISTPNQQSETTRGILGTLFSGICWGFSGACGQYLFTNYHMPSGLLTCIRMLLAGAILLIYCFLRKPKQMIAIWKNRKDALHLIAFSLLGLLFCQYTYLTTISHSNAGTATVLQYIGPVIILAADCVIKRRKPRALELIAILLAIAGTFLLATHGNPRTMVLSREALIWGLLSAVSLCLYTTLSCGISNRYGSDVIMSYGLLIGGIVLALLPGTFSQPVHLGMDGYLAMAGIITIGTIFAYVIYIYGVSVIGPVKGSLISSIEPVSATLFAVLWLGSSFVAMDFLGFACILSTIFLLAKSKTT